MSIYIKKFRAFLRRNETARGLFLVALVILGAVAVWEGTVVALNTQYPLLVVSSSSMCPLESCTLAVGALILIKGEDASSILAGPTCGQQAVGTIASPGQLGSIIVFRPYANNPGYLVVHRVREISIVNGQLVFRTEGDNWHTNPNCDPWTVTSSNLVGVYQFTVPIPYLGSAILAVRDFMYNSDTGQLNPQGILVIAALIIALFAFEILELGKKPSSKKVSVETAPPGSNES